MAEIGRAAGGRAADEGRKELFAGWQAVVPGLGIGLDLVQLLLIGAAYIFGLIERPPSSWAQAIGWTLLMAVFFFSTSPKDWLLTRGWAYPYLIARIALAALAVWVSDVSFLTTFLFFIIAAEAWGISPRYGRVSLVLSALAAYGVMFAIVGFARLDPYITLVPWLGGLAFTGATAHLARREQEARERSEALLAELGEAHRQLQRYAEQAGELATTQERNRIAREIHDSLGHYLTIINVQLESAQALRPRDAERADRAVGEAKRLASEALSDVRRSVAALRPTALDAVSISTAIERQVADFREHSGLAVELAIEGDEARCSQAAGLALYRTLQEGLTNIRKHAGAARVAVRLRFGPATTELAIGDDGRGIAPDPPRGPRPDGGGMGLTGLRERLALLGGTLEVRPGPQGGTELVATLPNRG